MSRDQRLRPQPRHRGRARASLEKKRPLCLVSIMVAGVVVASSSLASAGTCDPTDVACTAGEAVGGAGEAVGGAREAVGDLTDGPAEEAGGGIDGVTKPLEGAADPVREEVDKAVAEVSNTANELVSSVQDPTSPGVPGPGDGPSPTDPRNPATTSGQLRSSHRVSPRPGAHAERAGVAPARPETPAARPNVPELVTTSGAARVSKGEAALTASTSDGDRSRTLPGRLLNPDDLSKVVFPALLAALMLAFLLIQDRLDRSDPKLANAPMEGDNRLLNFQ